MSREVDPEIIKKIVNYFNKLEIGDPVRVKTNIKDVQSEYRDVLAVIKQMRCIDFKNHMAVERQCRTCPVKALCDLGDRTGQIIDPFK